MMSLIWSTLLSHRSGSDELSATLHCFSLNDGEGMTITTKLLQRLFTQASVQLPTSSASKTPPPRRSLPTPLLPSFNHKLPPGPSFL